MTERQGTCPYCPVINWDDDKPMLVDGTVFEGEFVRVHPECEMSPFWQDMIPKLLSEPQE